MLPKVAELPPTRNRNRDIGTANVSGECRFGQHDKAKTTTVTVASRESDTHYKQSRNLARPEL